MDVFDLRHRGVGEYSDFVVSFVTIQVDRVGAQVAPGMEGDQ